MAGFSPVEPAASFPASHNETETDMSRAARDLIELQRLAQSGAGALTEHLLRELAKNLIAAGVADSRGGC